MSHSVLEMPVSRPVLTMETHEMNGHDARTAAHAEADDAFTASQVNALYRDDAMTAGMIAIILGIAFTVLLGLVISVNVWTATAAG